MQIPCKKHAVIWLGQLMPGVAPTFKQRAMNVVAQITDDKTNRRFFHTKDLPAISPLFGYRSQVEGFRSMSSTMELECGAIKSAINGTYDKYYEEHLSDSESTIDAEYLANALYDAFYVYQIPSPVRTQRNRLICDLLHIKLNSPEKLDKRCHEVFARVAIDIDLNEEQMVRKAIAELTCADEIIRNRMHSPATNNPSSLKPK